MNTNPMIELNQYEICGIQGGAKADDPPRITDEEVLAIAVAATIHPAVGLIATFVAYVR